MILIWRKEKKAPKTFINFFFILIEYYYNYHYSSKSCADRSPSPAAHANKKTTSNVKGPDYNSKVKPNESHHSGPGVQPRTTSDEEALEQHKVSRMQTWG